MSVGHSSIQVSDKTTEPSRKGGFVHLISVDRENVRRVFCSAAFNNR